ncbi:MAG: hypothetical protein U1F68_00250 [Gammaproteobacteria bacterium]
MSSLSNLLLFSAANGQRCGRLEHSPPWAPWEARPSTRHQDNGGLANGGQDTAAADTTLTITAPGSN